MAQLQSCDAFTGAAIDDLFRGLFAPVRAEQSGAAAIKVDVAETDAGYVVRAEVPGVAKDEIQVTIDGNQVTLAAEAKRETGPKQGERVLHTERHVGQWFRSFVLPAEIDETASAARYEHGVLELKLVKKAASAGRRLSIQ